MLNFTINKNTLLQGEIVMNFFNIHCELRSILSVKTEKKEKRGYVCFFFCCCCYNAWNPL